RPGGAGRRGADERRRRRPDRREGGHRLRPLRLVHRPRPARDRADSDGRARRTGPRQHHTGQRPAPPPRAADPGAPRPPPPPRPRGCAMTTPAPPTRPLTLPPTPSRREQDFSRPPAGGPLTPSRREQDSSRAITG